MDNNESADTEKELEAFRQRWRNEISSRPSASTSTPRRTKADSSGPSKGPAKLPPTAERLPPPLTDAHGEVEGRTYHDLEDKDEYLKLGNEHVRSKAVAKEPRSALEHYEKAVERESQGNLGDSVQHYRKAFKLDAGVQEEYKKKYFPAPSKPIKPAALDSASSAADTRNASAQPAPNVPKTLNELMDDFSQLSIAVAEPETDLSPPLLSPITQVPDEVLIEIIRAVGQNDVANYARLALTCKRLAFLTMTEDRIWKPVALGPEYGIRGMHYGYSCNLKGAQLLYSTDVPRPPAQFDQTPSAYPTYRAQFRHRPRIRFNGCYISTVNYPRPGGSSQSRYTWSTPVHIVTYYRYLRFFRDGSCISLLTTTEPADTVHHLTKENLHCDHANNLPSAVMKDALRGRWRLSGAEKIVPEEELFEDSKGPGEYEIEPFDDSEIENEGILHIETEGVTPKYMWKMKFAIGSAGRKDATRNNKLSWLGFWSYNRLADDWGEFGLKNDRAFYWSRVKSY